MRKLLICLTLLLGISGSASAESWKRMFAENSSGESLYVDKKNIIKKGNKAKIWWMLDLKKREKGKKYLSAIYQTEFDCRERLYKEIYTESFSGNMGLGSSLYSQVKTSKWTPFRPSSFLKEALWWTACGKPKDYE